MQLNVNGQIRKFNETLTISQLLQKLDLSPERVVVELNREILTSAAFSTLLKDGDAVELIQFVGGG